MFPQWKPPIAEPAVRCTYALQIVVVRGDGTIHQITREGTSVEQDKPSLNVLTAAILTEQAAALRQT
jgi:hypothetical protein